MFPKSVMLCQVKVRLSFGRAQELADGILHRKAQSLFGNDQIGVFRVHNGFGSFLTRSFGFNGLDSSTRP